MSVNYLCVSDIIIMMTTSAKATAWRNCGQLFTIPCVLWLRCIAAARVVRAAIFHTTYNIENVFMVFMVFISMEHHGAVRCTSVPHSLACVPEFVHVSHTHCVHIDHGVATIVCSLLYNVLLKSLCKLPTSSPNISRYHFLILHYRAPHYL